MKLKCVVAKGFGVLYFQKSLGKETFCQYMLVTHSWLENLRPGSVIPPIHSKEPTKMH